MNSYSGCSKSIIITLIWSNVAIRCEQNQSLCSYCMYPKVRKASKPPANQKLTLRELWLLAFLAFRSLSYIVHNNVECCFLHIHITLLDTFKICMIILLHDKCKKLVKSAWCLVWWKGRLRSTDLKMFKQYSSQFRRGSSAHEIHAWHVKCNKYEVKKVKEFMVDVRGQRLTNVHSDCGCRWRDTNSSCWGFIILW